MTARSSSSPRRNHQYPIDDHDLISKLPDELLQMVLSNLSTEEAVRTSVLSSRWVDVWKWRSYLVLDMNMVLDSTPKERLQQVSVQLARLMTKVETNIWHKILGSDFIDMRRYVYLSVSVDITDPKEVEILEEVLLMWTNGLLELEIFFKHKKSHREEGECSTNDRTHAKLFPNADLRVYNVRLYNFDGSNEEEFAFVSRLVMQKPVILNMMIETSLFPPTKKFNAEAAVAKLMELKYYKNLKIECF
ncbi:unnamed protein product [Brassica napus]|uniref:(rape) hypothetical protein n=1 Tax=Brassica napus TaxID=3708 RepID=A0A816PGK9_BRANA|nr:unnamed protein product [Brassica napus]